MPELIAFFGARLDEEAAEAGVWVPPDGNNHIHRHLIDGPAWREHSHVGAGEPHKHDEFGYQEKVYRQYLGPARELWNIAADRRILGMLEPRPGLKLPEGAVREALEDVIRIRAARFSGHRDYRQQWKPEAAR